jgi:hypothetical protein
MPSTGPVRVLPDGEFIKIGPPGIFEMSPAPARGALVVPRPDRPLRDRGPLQG